MKYQEPAEGICKNGDFGDAKFYDIVCECGSPDHTHKLWVESDEFGTITVNISTIEKTNWWKNTIELRYDINNWYLQRLDWFWKGLVNGLLHKLKITKDVWFNGYVQYEASLILNKQTALNYAKTLEQAIQDVTEYRNTSSK